MRPAMTQRQVPILLVANMVGVGLYLWLSSWTWTPPIERGLGLDSAGNDIVWGLTALPVLATFFVLDFSWVVVILCRRQWKSGRTWLLAAMIWLVALAIDRANHS